MDSDINETLGIVLDTVNPFKSLQRVVLGEVLELLVPSWPDVVHPVSEDLTWLVICRDHRLKWRIIMIVFNLSSVS